MPDRHFYLLRHHILFYIIFLLFCLLAPEEIRTSGRTRTYPIWNTRLQEGNIYPKKKSKWLKSIYGGISFAVQIGIQLIVECDFPINVLGYLYRTSGGNSACFCKLIVYSRKIILIM